MCMAIKRGTVNNFVFSLKLCSRHSYQYFNGQNDQFYIRTDIVIAIFISLVGY